MKPIIAVARNALLALAAVGAFGALGAQENAPPPAAPAPPASSPPAGAPPAREPLEAPELPSDVSNASDESDDTFIPTQELGADEQVTFPVDI